MDFTYVTDVARSVVAALESDCRDLAFNVGTGKSTSLRELAQTLCKVMGSDLEPEFQAARGVSPVNYRLVDTSLAQNVLGFRTQVDVREGLDHLVTWWRSQKS